MTIVYSYLAELEKESFIELSKIEDRKKVYRITEKGRKLIDLME